MIGHCKENSKPEEEVGYKKTRVIDNQSRVIGSYPLGSTRKIQNQMKKFDRRRPGMAAEYQRLGGWKRDINQGD